MMNFADGKSGTDQELPTGGQILGHIADAFQLKARFKDAYDWPKNPRTHRRYFNGEQHKVKPETAAAIIEHLVRSFLSDAILASTVNRDNEEFYGLVTEAITRLCVHWDIRDFDQFYETRRNVIAQRLRDLLGVEQPRVRIEGASLVDEESMPG